MAPGNRLLGLYLHGSLVAGDFAVNRSDLDLLAVLVDDPDEKLLDVLAELQSDLDRRHPQWAGRIEVDYVSLDVAHGGANRDLLFIIRPTTRATYSAWI
ncbi:hypothetical protein ACIA7R_29995 [Micromonospora chalcea]|nr:hypothetical protein AMK25_06565 [Micromonospora sp. TSRI0369]